MSGATYKIGISQRDIENVFSASLSEKQTKDVLNRLSFPFVKVSPRNTVITLAEQYIGKPYKYGASVSGDAPESFDCSSFVAYLYVQAGISIPRISVDQYVLGKEVSEKDLKAGDVIYSNTGTGSVFHQSVEVLPNTKILEGVDHCGVYVGNGEIIHATRTSGKVTKEKISESQKFKDIVGYRRFIQDETDRYVVSVPFEMSDIRKKENLITRIKDLEIK